MVNFKLKNASAAAASLNGLLHERSKNDVNVFTPTPKT